MATKDDYVGGKIVYSAKKRQASACATSNKRTAHQFNERLTRSRNNIQTIILGGNSNVIVQRLFPSSRPQSTTHCLGKSRPEAFKSSNFALSSPQSFMNPGRSKEFQKYPKQGKTSMKDQAMQRIPTRTKHIGPKSIIGSAYSSVNYSPFEISASAVPQLGNPAADAGTEDAGAKKRQPAQNQEIKIMEGEEIAARPS